MKIQTTHRFTFQHEGAEFTTAGSNTVEVAPDWIVNDDYFRAAKAADRLVELDTPVQVVEAETLQVTEPVDATFEPEDETAEDEKPKRARKAKADAEDEKAE
jgi:hypothetical protein